MKSGSSEAGKHRANTEDLGMEVLRGDCKNAEYRPVVTVDLYAGVAVVGRHDAVLREHEVDRAARLPPLQLHRHRRVGLGVPLSK